MKMLNWDKSGGHGECSNNDKFFLAYNRFTKSDAWEGPLS